ncbi:MAG: response regulator [Candidatus Omnitrophota bacterium]
MQDSAKRILIVDDDQEIAEELGQILIEEGYNITYASDGLKAREFLGKNSYDLVLLDIKMPGLNGFEVLKEIRGKDIHTKVIILSGSLMIDKYLNSPAGALEKGEGKALGLADRLLAKPVNPDLLISKIKELIP